MIKALGTSARIPSRTQHCGNPFPASAGRDSRSTRDEMGIASQPEAHTLATIESAIASVLVRLHAEVRRALAAPNMDRARRSLARTERATDSE